MAETIEFDKTHFYSMFDVGITISVNLFYADKEVEFDAKIDTGSTFCIFQRLHGELLDLEIENGTPADIGTATGSFRAFGHELTPSCSIKPNLTLSSQPILPKTLRSK